MLEAGNVAVICEAGNRFSYQYFIAQMHSSLHSCGLTRYVQFFEPKDPSQALSFFLPHLRHHRDEPVEGQSSWWWLIYGWPQLA